MTQKKRLLSAVVSAAIFIMEFLPWYQMYTRTNRYLFTMRFVSELKYFTTDSNLLMGLAALIHLLFSVGVLLGMRKKVPGWAELFFYMTTTSLFLTFGMVMVYLGPIFGYGKMLEKTSLYFHLIVPVLSIFSMCLLHRDRRLSLKDSFLALIPLFLYGIYYLGMIYRYGVRSQRTDWYRLAVGGKMWMPFVFLLIVVCTWGGALLIRLSVNSGSEKQDTGKTRQKGR